MRGPCCRIAHSEEGQGLVEGAFVFTILSLMVLAIIDFAYLYQTFIGVTNAASQGAMYAANDIGYDSARIQAAALAEGSMRHCRTLVVSSTAPQNDAFGLPMVSVTVRCEVDDLMLLPE